MRGGGGRKGPVLLSPSPSSCASPWPVTVPKARAAPPQLLWPPKRSCLTTGGVSAATGLAVRSVGSGEDHTGGDEGAAAAAAIPGPEVAPIGIARGCGGSTATCSAAMRRRPLCIRRCSMPPSTATPSAAASGTRWSGFGARLASWVGLVGGGAAASGTHWSGSGAQLASWADLVGGGAAASGTHWSGAGTRLASWVGLVGGGSPIRAEA
eukprot:351612-Chlamydomonas_euryale.AAC.5